MGTLDAEPERRSDGLVHLRPIAILLVAAVAGCGSNADTATEAGANSEKTFRHELRAVQIRIESAKSNVSSQLQVARLGRRRDASEVSALVDALSEGVDQLAALKPPDSLRAPLRRYVTAYRHLVESLRRFARLLAGHDRRALEREGQVAQTAAGEIARARDALDAKLADSG
jgi:hypothetical protein